MKAKKIFKVIGIVFLILLLLIILFLMTTSAVYHIKLNNIEKQLKEAGYFNFVSVGDNSLNVYSCGNENGKHTIIAMAGWGDGEMNIGWRQMTTKVEKDNRLIFIDRFGYGLSDDTNREMTAENVVEDYRIALQNMGIEAPYILMGHSMGGIYATYWESKYPDEIEAIIFVDGSVCFEIPKEEQLNGDVITSLMPAAEKLGLMPFLIRSEFGQFLDSLPEEKTEQALYMMCKTAGSSAAASETKLDDRNIDYVWNEMVTTDIPKLYISATFAYHTKEDFKNDNIPAESLLYVWTTDPSLENAEDDAIYNEALKLMDKLRTEKFEPYIEKLGNCEVVELPGHHIIYLDKPDECNGIVKKFIDSLDR